MEQDEMCTHRSWNGDGVRLIESGPMVLVLSIVGNDRSSESIAVRFVYVPENLFDRVGPDISDSGNATDGFCAKTCCNSVCCMLLSCLICDKAEI